MDNKELDEILQKYAESTKNDRDVAFKKLNETQQKVKRPSKRVKPQYILAMAMCAIVIVVCITLPIMFTIDSPQNSYEPRYCESSDTILGLEENLSVLTEEYGINAYYPTCDADFMVSSILSRTDSTLHGAQLSFVVDEWLIFVDVSIVPKTHILQLYEIYFTLSGERQWKDYDLLFASKYNPRTDFYEMRIYFTDGHYDYFVMARSIDELDPLDLLNIIYP